MKIEGTSIRRSLKKVDFENIERAEVYNFNKRNWRFYTNMQTCPLKAKTN